MYFSFFFQLIMDDVMSKSISHAVIMTVFYDNQLSVLQLQSFFDATGNPLIVHCTASIFSIRARLSH